MTNSIQFTKYLKKNENEKYKEWIKQHEKDYYFAIVKIEKDYYAVAFEWGDRAAWAVRVKKKRGGARQGAGRPRKYNVPVCIRLKPTEKLCLEDTAKVCGFKNTSELLKEIIKDIDAYRMIVHHFKNKK